MHDVMPPSHQNSFFFFYILILIPSYFTLLSKQLNKLVENVKKYTLGIINFETNLTMCLVAFV
jgi:hypothetical protein